MLGLGFLPSPHQALLLLLPLGLGLDEKLVKLRAVVLRYVQPLGKLPSVVAGGLLRCQHVGLQLDNPGLRSGKLRLEVRLHLQGDPELLNLYRRFGQPLLVRVPLGCQAVHLSTQSQSLRSPSGNVSLPGSQLRLDLCNTRLESVGCGHGLA